MTGRKPRLQVAALDLYRSLEFHVQKISAVAGGVDGGLRGLQQPCDLGDGKQAVIRDAANDRGGQGVGGWRQSGVSSAVDSGCIGLQNCRARGLRDRLRFQRLDSRCIAMHILVSALPKRRSPVRTRCSAPSSRARQRKLTGPLRLARMKMLEEDLATTSLVRIDDPVKRAKILLGVDEDLSATQVYEQLKTFRDSHHPDKYQVTRRGRRPTTDRSSQARGSFRGVTCASWICFRISPHRRIDALSFRPPLERSRCGSQARAVHFLSCQFETGWRTRPSLS